VAAPAAPQARAAGELVRDPRRRSWCSNGRAGASSRCSTRCSPLQGGPTPFPS
jgi:hypothetical protein